MQTIKIVNFDGERQLIEVPEDEYIEYEKRELDRELFDQFIDDGYILISSGEGSKEGKYIVLRTKSVDDENKILKRFLIHCHSFYVMNINGSTVDMCFFNT